MEPGMSKFDNEINNILAKKIARAKRRTVKKYGKLKPPDNHKSSGTSPAVKSGATPDQTIADAPYPM